MRSDESPGQVTAETQELRLATAMTGGVSHAIWMGGARELNARPLPGDQEVEPNRRKLIETNAC